MLNGYCGIQGILSNRLALLPAKGWRVQSFFFLFFFFCSIFMKGKSVSLKKSVYNVQKIIIKVIEGQSVSFLSIFQCVFHKIWCIFNKLS